MEHRLQQFLDAENISQSQFAETIGISRASISLILSGRNKPGYDFIENTMSHYPALNIEWLISGRGRMYKTSAQESPAPSSLFPQQSEAVSTETAPSQTPRSIKSILIFYDDDTYEEVKKI